MKFKAGLMAILLAIAAIAPLTSPLPAHAAAASYCQCVTYVQNYVGYINAYYAKDAGPALKARGYRESATPMGINDIVVLQPGFAGASGYGHIAFLASYRKSGSTVTATLRGTNQPGGWWTDHSCYNVSLWTITYSNNWGIRFYRR